MLDFPVLVAGRVMPLIADGLAKRVPVLMLHESQDLDAFLAQHAQAVRGLVPGAGAKRVDGGFMSRLPNLKIVSNFGVGYDGIDAVWAGAHGVVVTNTPDVLTDEVADLAMGLLIATIRQLPQSDRYLRDGRWLREGAYPLTATLRGRRMGILGLGRIGKAIARRASAFDIDLCYHGRSLQPDVGLPYYPSLVEMAKAVDILMIVTPGGPSTNRIVNAEVLAALGPEGILINVARGTVVDEQALAAALSAGTIMAGGLDVFEKEPHVPDALIALPNTVLLPHVGSASVHTRNAMGQLVVDNIVSFAAGQGPLTPVRETPWPLGG